MTSRMLAPHTTCPGCREEVFLDELVKGRCPLCGCTLEDFEEGSNEMDLGDRADFSWLVFNYFIFRKFDRLGVPPLRIMDLIAGCVETGVRPDQTRYEFEIPMNFLDKIRPKYCKKCGKYFLSGGKKIIAGDLGGPSVEVSYLCKKDQ
ncbi:MAG: hypothetical protein LUQ25_02305 [Methanoregulaceae archaeon]|nr:hypothetical protein [Methanoregulaceae archaeon]